MKRASVALLVFMGLLYGGVLSTPAYGSERSILKRIAREETDAEQRQFKEQITKNLNAFLHQYDKYDFIKRKWRDD